jgi:hypothetical protein
VDKPDPNVTHYTFDKSWQIYSVGAYFVIDPDGVIVDSGGEVNNDEAKVGALIDVLLHRHN